MVNWLIIGIGGVFAVIGLLMLLSGIGRLRAWNEIRGTSAGAVTGPGTVEVEGVAKPLRETLDPPHGTADSLAYRYEQEERRRDPDPDEHGKEWHTVENERDSVPFVVESGADEVLVDPGDADFLFEKSSDRQGDRRHKSARLDVGEAVYVAGQAVPAAEADVTPDGQRYTITDGGSMLGKKLSGLTGTPFVIADMGEDAAEDRLLRSAIFGLVLAVVVLGIATIPILFGLSA